MNNLEKVEFYKKSYELWNLCWLDTETLVKDFRGKEISKQLIRAVGSISANIEEGYGRGMGKEYIHFLRIARGSAIEAKGWYLKSSSLLLPEIIESRTKQLVSITAMITKSIETLEIKRNTSTSTDANR